jgi:hypothetical protein
MGPSPLSLRGAGAPRRRLPRAVSTCFAPPQAWVKSRPRPHGAGAAGRVCPGWLAAPRRQLGVDEQIPEAELRRLRG